MNKVELLSPDQRGALRAALRRRNREARVLESTYSAVDLSEILNTGLFSMAKAASAPGWLADLQARPRVLQNPLRFVPTPQRPGCTAAGSRVPQRMGGSMPPLIPRSASPPRWPPL